PAPEGRHLVVRGPPVYVVSAADDQASPVWGVDRQQRRAAGRGAAPALTFDHRVPVVKLRGPKGRLARRPGIALSPKTARILERRPTPPGQHGSSRRPGKTSEYHKQLLEKQRLRAQYGISESQLRALYRKATRLRGNTGERLLQLRSE